MIARSTRVHTVPFDTVALHHSRALNPSLSSTSEWYSVNVTLPQWIFRMLPRLVKGRLQPSLLPRKMVTHRRSSIEFLNYAHPNSASPQDSITYITQPPHASWWIADWCEIVFVFDMLRTLAGAFNSTVSTRASGHAFRAADALGTKLST